MAKDIGGMTNVLLVFFSIIVYPMANHSFMIRAIKRFYFVRTKDKKLFEYNKKKHKKVIQDFQ